MSVKVGRLRVLFVSLAMISLGSVQAQNLESFTQSLPDSVVKLKMVAVPAGAVKVGDKTVELKPFWIAETETVWELFDLFLASGPPTKPRDETEYPADAIARPSKSYILPDRGWGHAGFPTISINQLTADMFCRWLSKTTGKKYRLPTIAEWEWACRGAEASGAAPKDTGSVAWFSANSEKVTHAVAKKQPNKLGLYDMYGNVGEWARREDGELVLCGGRYLDGPDAMKPDFRLEFDPGWQESDPQFPKSRWWLSDGSFCGFRVVCEP